MTQAPKKKRRKLPKDITEREDREVMERIFGKRIMKKLDAIVREESEPLVTKED